MSSAVTVVLLTGSRRTRRDAHPATNPTSRPRDSRTRGERDVMGTSAGWRPDRLWVNKHGTGRLGRHSRKIPHFARALQVSFRTPRTDFTTLDGDAHGD